MARRAKDDDTSLPEAEAGANEAGTTGVAPAEPDEQTLFNQIVKQAGGGELANASKRATEFIAKYPHLEDRLRAAMPKDAQF